MTNINIGALYDILYDTYEMDAQMPPFFGKRREEFKRLSYKQWALEEFQQFYVKKSNRRQSLPLDEAIKIAEEFSTKVRCYLKSSESDSRLIFQTATEAINDILDLLYAMR